jgi:hypothetical protein
MPIQRGGCHCGAIRFEVEGEPSVVTICNCSICAMTGYLHWEVEPAHFHLLTSDDAILTYEFGTRTAKHHFCRECGISPFRRSRVNPEAIDVNARCVEGVDVEKLEVEHFDGQNWEEAAAAVRG